MHHSLSLRISRLVFSSDRSIPIINRFMGSGTLPSMQHCLAGATTEEVYATASLKSVSLDPPLPPFSLTRLPLLGKKEQ